MPTHDLILLVYCCSDQVPNTAAGSQFSEPISRVTSRYTHFLMTRGSLIYFKYVCCPPVGRDLDRRFRALRTRRYSWP